MSQELFKNLFDQTDSQDLFADSKAMFLVRVAFENAGDQLYDYAIPSHLQSQCLIGQRVKAPLGRSNKIHTGFCVGFPDQSESSKIKHITEIIDTLPLLDSNMIELAQWISRYYCCPLGSTLAAMVPSAVKKNIGTVKRTYLKLSDLGQSFTIISSEACRLSAKGRTILEYIHKHINKLTDSIALDDVAAAVGATRSPFLTLAKSGYIEIYQTNELPLLHAIEPEFQRSDNFVLNPDQQNAIQSINHLIDQGNFSTTLLYGVTGSGKTEVYLSCIEHVIKQGKQAIVLVPEIALTPQTESRFLRRFGRVAVLHSGMSNSLRHQQWRWIADGTVNVVVGARSAIFAPLCRPGLIVVDEEHEPSYKQDKSPRYHGRDVAIKRAQIHNIPIILGSATPSLESLFNSRNRSNFNVVHLPNRVKELPMPKVLRVNMREEIKERKGNHLFSRLLEEQLQQCIAHGNQAILFLNRRGHSNFIYCPSCQYIHTCPNCDVSLTYHRQMDEFEQSVHRMMVCHYCLHSCRVPGICPLCKGKLILIGPGTQKAEDELNEKFPNIRVQRVDSDSVNPADYANLLKNFGEGKIDVLLGTQMIGKGLDFPNVALVGVLSADMALSLPDFRSAERTFQLIVQVAGRCGRSIDNGIVVVQSFLPDEPSIAMACRHDYLRFAEMELKARYRCQMPPCHRMARIIMRHHKLEPLQNYSQDLRLILDQTKEKMGLQIEIRGPVPAAIARLETYHRYEILLKSPSAVDIQRILGANRSRILSENKIQAVVDVDPIYLM